MKDYHGNSISIKGWVQFGNPKSSEISQLEVELGNVHTTITLNVPCDELIDWCQHHNLPFTDMRKR